MLKVDSVRFQHPGGNHVDYSFNLNVAEREIAGITGQSGSGKSTLLDLIAGFLQPLAGDITWHGDSILSLPPERRPVTILFQNHNLFDHLSAWANVAIGLNPTLRLSTEEKHTVKTALEDAGLAGLDTRRAAKLSGGQQQRVALARCLVRKTPVLLLDEPFSALDADTKSDMLDLVQNIARTRSRAVVMVTHDAADCEKIANLHYVMRAGSLHHQ